MEQQRRSLQALHRHFDPAGVQYSHFQPTGAPAMKLRSFASMLLLPSLLWSASVFAANPADETVIIRNDGDNTYYEYRVNGEITEIKVVPKKGPAYYLVPSTLEDGEFVRKDQPEMRVPKWVIFRW